MNDVRCAMSGSEADAREVGICFEVMICNNTGTLKYVI